MKISIIWIFFLYNNSNITFYTIIWIFYWFWFYLHKIIAEGPLWEGSVRLKVFVPSQQIKEWGYTEVNLIIKWKFLVENIN